MVKDFLTNSHKKAALRKSREREDSDEQAANPDVDIIEDRPSYIDLQKTTAPASATPDAAGTSANGEEAASSRLVNVSYLEATYQSLARYIIDDGLP